MTGQRICRWRGLSARLAEREGQLSEAEDCYRKLDDLYQAEKSDHAAALASKVWL